MKRMRIYVGSLLLLLGIAEIILAVTEQAPATKVIVAIAFTALAALGGVIFLLPNWKREEKESLNQIPE